MICVTFHVVDGFVEGTLLWTGAGYDLFMGYRVAVTDLGGTPSAEQVETFFNLIYTFFVG